SFAAIPSEVLMSLSALPVGGVRGTNRSDLPSPSERVQAPSAEPQIRLTLLNQPSTRSQPEQEPQKATPVEPNPLALPRTSVPPAADSPRQSSSDLPTLFKGFTYTLEGVWRRTLDDLIMNGDWQGRL